MIHTPEYDFYYYPWNDGPESDRAILGYTVVKRLWLGWRRIGSGVEGQPVYNADGVRVGKLYTYEGQHTDYHIFMLTLVGVPVSRDLLPPYTLVINGKEYEMIENSFFITDHLRQITEFELNGLRLTVTP